MLFWMVCVFLLHIFGFTAVIDLQSLHVENQVSRISKSFSQLFEFQYFHVFFTATSDMLKRFTCSTCLKKACTARGCLHVLFFWNNTYSTMFRHISLFHGTVLTHNSQTITFKSSAQKLECWQFLKVIKSVC